MGSNVLQFSLGLATGGFLSALTSARGAVAEFVVGLLGFEAVRRGIESALEKGEQLQHLSAQVQEPVKDLYQLGEAMKAVGVDTSQLQTMILYMRYALSGISSTGQRTDAIFAQMGLSMTKLRGEAVAQQISDITAALSRMNTTSATGAAAALFGIRTGAVNFLQIAGSQKDFAEALKDSAQEAAVFARNASFFEHFETTIGRIQGRVSAMFAGIAEGLVPALQDAADKLKQIDAVGFGEGVGKAINGLANAFKNGQITELVGESLWLGMETLVVAAPGIFAEVGTIMIKALEPAFDVVQSLMEYSLEAGAHKFATSSRFAWLMKVGAPGAAQIFSEIGDPGKPDFVELFLNRVKQGPRFNLGSGEFGISGMAKGASDYLGWVAKFMGPQWQALADTLKNLAGPGGPLEPHPNGFPGPGVTQPMNIPTPGWTNLEKMGFVMTDGANPILDPTRQTARNTEKTAAYTAQLVSLLTGSGSIIPLHAI